MQNKLISVLIGSLFLPAFALADDVVVVPERASTFRDLTQILDSNTVEKARLEGAKIKDEYARLNTSPGTAQADSGMAIDSTANERGEISSLEAPRPTVDFIYGTGKSLKARLRLYAAGTVTVGKGDVVFGDYKVIGITPRQVTLMDKNKGTFKASSTSSGF